MATLKVLAQFPHEERPVYDGFHPRTVGVKRKRIPVISGEPREPKDTTIP